MYKPQLRFASCHISNYNQIRDSALSAPLDARTAARLEVVRAELGILIVQLKSKLAQRS